MYGRSLISLTVLCISLDYAQFEQVKDYEWDLLIFTQHWPETVCKEWTHHKPTHKCNLPNKHDSWSIHGIWPTKLGTRGPENCNATWLFDPEQVKPIEDDLEQAWVNIEKGTPLYSFWAHEWTKHGTCAAILDSFNSEFKYFSQGLNWLKTYSMTNILESAAIVPSNDKLYNNADIHAAVKKGTGKNAFIACKSQDKQQYLAEIRICFNKKSELIDCDGITYFKKQQDDTLGNCKATEGILYPEYDAPPQRINVQLYKFVNWLQWYTL